MTDQERKAMEMALKTMERIVNSNWRNWAELASPEEFERLVNTLANHCAEDLRQALAQPEQPEIKQGWDVDTLLSQPEQEPVACECHRCIKENDLREGAFPLSATRMILCPECGNKRCPKASDHRLACTGSNESGQEGSIYTAPPSKPWVSLTNEQISSLKNLQGANRERTATEMAFAVDAKLKELNHG